MKAYDARGRIAPAWRRAKRWFAAGAGGLCILAVLGCAAGPTPPDDLKGVRAAEQAAKSPTPPTPAAEARPAALLNGQPISWDDLRPSLTEAAGGVVLREVALDRLLDAELAARRLSVTEEDVTAERHLLLEAIVRDAAASPADAERLLERLRRARGLGEVRFARLLERNAKMRKIVAGDVQVSDEEVAQAFEIRHGAKYRGRVIVVPTRDEAAKIRGEVLAEPWDLGASFGTAAARLSTDPSAPRGGLTEPISPADPAYPAAVRAVLARLKIGEMSDTIAIDRGYALVLLEEVIPADGVTLASAGEGIRGEVLRRRERVTMDDLGRRLLAKAGLSALDRDLDWSLKAGAAPEP